MSEGAIVEPVAEGLVPEHAAPASHMALKAALKAAWLAIGLGLGVQALIVVAHLLAGGTANPLAFVASLGQGITWSVVVCAGVAIGTVISRAKSLAMGLLGLVAGPLAWGFAKGTQKGLQAMMAIPEDKIDNFFLMITGLKGLEYAVLGAGLGFMVGKAWAKLPAFAVFGLGIGILFAAIVLSLTVANKPATPLPALVGMGVNEIIVPLGCSLVIYAVQRLKHHVERISAH
ncbi:MAG: hypothetical protein U1E87_02570 [Alphaproteobacteria bacterium]